MGKADSIAKDYIKKAEVFADIFNQFLYQGKQVILPKKLQEIDSTMLAVPYGTGDAGVPVQKYRDELQILAGKTDGNAAYCVLGVEGPLTLREMYSTQDESIIRYAPDYRVNLLAPHDMTDEEIGRFRTDLKGIMLYIKYSKDKVKLEKLMKENRKDFNMDRTAADLLNTVTNSRLKYPEGKEKVDVCQAIQEMRQESEQIGEARGMSIGEARGITIGEERMKARAEKAEAINQEQEAYIRKLEQLLEEKDSK